MLGRKAIKDLKGKKAGDDDIAIAMDRIANLRLQANEDRKVARNLEDEVEAQRAALEERLAANKERSWHWRRRRLPTRSTNA
jgi:predicted  nucleic acid-binding Zn-ribbon protein